MDKDTIKYRHFLDILVADANDLINYINSKLPSQQTIINYESGEPIVSKIKPNEFTYFSSGYLAILDSAGTGIIRILTYNQYALLEIVIANINGKIDALTTRVTNNENNITTNTTNITNLTNKVNDLIIKQDFFSETFSIQSGNSYTTTISYTVPSGYKFLSVSNIATSGFIAPATVGGQIQPIGYFNVYVSNVFSSTITGSIVASILFIKE